MLNVDQCWELAQLGMWGGKHFPTGVSHCSSSSLPDGAFEHFGFGCREAEAEGPAVLLAQGWGWGLEDRDLLAVGGGAHDAMSTWSCEGQPKVTEPQRTGVLRVVKNRRSC